MNNQEFSFIFVGMSRIPTIFLESHNIKNPFSGFGQFNYHLIKGIYGAGKCLIYVVHFMQRIPALYKKNLEPILITKNTTHYIDAAPFRIREKYDVWHCLNQNIKVEPHYDIPYVLTVHDVNFIDEVSTDLNHESNKRFQAKLDRSDMRLPIFLNILKNLRTNILKCPMCLSILFITEIP